MIEKERKYLLFALPGGLPPGGVNVRQGYLTIGDPEVRVRQKGDKFFVTRKGGEGFIREEAEEEVSSEVFEILWPATVGKRIEKTRYELVGPDGYVWEVDEYHGSLTGLFTAEVELPPETAEAVVLPAVKNVLITDVTDDKRYKNKKLAVNGLPEGGEEL